MLNISHAKMAQDLATETKYRTFLHKYTTLPTDLSIAWAKKANDLQSDVSLLIGGIYDAAASVQILVCL